MLKFYFSGAPNPTKVVGDHWLSGAQCEPGRRGKIGSHTGFTDDARRPSHARSHKQSLLLRKVLQHLGVVGLQPNGGERRRPVQQLLKRRVLQGRNAQFGEELLLPDALVEGAQGHIGGVALGVGFDNGLLVRTEVHARRLPERRGLCRR
ncbi:MAG: hypothetical protein HC869_13780 [Rhodospirillales bacterium]|nr:hypothetical protein [Rhodospirillales bacterium]